MFIKGKGAVEAVCVIHCFEEGYRMSQVKRNKV